MISGKRGLAAAALAALLFAPAAAASIPSAADLALAPPALPELKPASIEATTDPESCGAFCQRLEVRLEVGLFGGGNPSLLALDAWGNYRNPAELEASKNRFGFTGHLFDRETGTYYAKARYFDPELGRFLTQDSYLGEIDNPPSLHRFLYANANPVRFTDPTGHCAECPVELAGMSPEQRLAQAREQAAQGQRLLGGAVGVLQTFGETLLGAAEFVMKGMRGGPYIPEAETVLALSQVAANPRQAIVERYDEMQAEVARREASGDHFGAGRVSGHVASADALLILGTAEAIGAGTRGLARFAKPNAPRVVAQPLTEGSPATADLPLDLKLLGGERPGGAGEFSIINWTDYPVGVPRPSGPFRLVEGAEYEAARRAANAANNAIRREQGLGGQPVDIHEITPVKFGGSPVASVDT